MSGPERLTSLAPVAAAAALGRPQELDTALESALQADCSATEIRETLLTVALFAGFPRTLDALSTASEVLRRRGVSADTSTEPGLPESEAERRALFRARGGELFARVYGDDTDRVLERLAELDPELDAWILEDAYGKVLARAALPAPERERLAVVLLAALELRNQLPGHVRGAIRCGATRDQIEASVAAAAHLIPAYEIARVRTTLERLDD